MTTIAQLKELPRQQMLGNQAVFVLQLGIKVAAGSFLHVGGTPSPLTEKKQPVFSVDGQPVIPASSFKGAFRQQVEMLLIERQAKLAGDLGLSGDKANLLKPSIPAARPSRAEQDLVGNGYRREHSEIKAEQDRVQVSPGGLCPVSYFLGATGLEGYLRIPNFMPQAGDWRIDQTRIRIDRQSQTAASGAIVTGEQVKPGTLFTGRVLIFGQRNGAAFGRCRVIGGTRVDLWLDIWAEDDDARRQLFLVNEIVIPALNNLRVLGGQKSLGGGRVEIALAS